MLPQLSVVFPGLGKMWYGCGMAMKGMGMLGVSVRKKKALTVKMETVTLIGKVGQNVTSSVYQV
jgi:hypothetical protein